MLKKIKSEYIIVTVKLKRHLRDELLKRGFDLSFEMNKAIELLLNDQERAITPKKEYFAKRQ